MSQAAHQSTPEWDRSQFVRCNTIGHAWFDCDSDWTPLWGTPLTVRCERCGSERRDTLGGASQVIKRKYWHPDGYKYARGTRPTRNEFRAMLVALRKKESK